ncbi:MAG TPA: enoyl-CoA hydratase/isomerase family protein, partial [Oculatellaceae cyanobacterium]
MGEFVRVEVASGVARVCLNRSELHNAFNEIMIQELSETFASLHKDAQVRAVVLEGVGKSFCAGADLHWMKKMVDYTFEQNVEDAQELSRMLKTIYHCGKPVIARVHGAAFGGGVGLIAACDMAIAVESATFCLSEVKLGLLPAVISPFVLKKIGEAAAHRYFLTAERFSAQEAYRIGLVSEVVPDEAALDQKLDSILQAIQANGPEAIAFCKILIDKICPFNWDGAVDITTKMIAERRASAEGQEGMRAFLEKRLPVWVQNSG